MRRRQNNRTPAGDVADLISAFLAKGGTVTQCPTGPQYKDPNLFDYPDAKRETPQAAELFGASHKQSLDRATETPMRRGPKPLFGD